MVNTPKPTIVAAPPTSARTRFIGCERDAAEAYGENSELHLWAREFLGRPSSALVPMVPTPAPAVPAAPTRWPAVLLPPALPPEDLEQHLFAFEYDPRRSAVPRCTLDGEEVPLEEVSPGVWRPVPPPRTQVSG